MSDKQLKRFRLSSSFYRNVKKRSCLEQTAFSLPLPSTSNDVSQEHNSENTLLLSTSSFNVSQETSLEKNWPSTSRQESENFAFETTVFSDCNMMKADMADLSGISRHPITVEEVNDHIFSNCDDNDSSNSDITDDQDDDMQIAFIARFRHWALKNQVRQNTLNELLQILIDTAKMDFLPKDSRSLLQTPRKNNIVAMGSGNYWYNGLRNCITEVYSESQKKLPTNLCLTFNIDGLPIAKSSKEQFWPILCKINEKDVKTPLVIAIYNGSTKPPVNDFLRPFVEELLILLKEGILIKNQVINIKIRCFICDTPARCFIKGTMGFNSYHGCMKCTIIGEYDRRYRHMSFARTDLPLRTDSSFRNREDQDHHKEKTLIEDLPIDLVKDFPVADALHLLDLGVMKRCLVGWTSGNFNFKTKWSAKDMKDISRLIAEMKSLVPKEVHQGRMRDLETVHFWKGTEFKNFLLYYGPVLLKDYLPFEIYQHFLTLFCATTICYNEAYKPYWHIAQQLYEDYVEKFAEIYGQDSVGSNIHNLCHIVNDITRFGCLPSLSAYPFESKLFNLKKMLRKGELPLSQVANRLQELSKFKSNDKDFQAYPVVKYEKQLETGEKVFTAVILNEYCTLSSKEEKNKWFLSTDNHIIEMDHAVFIKGEIKVKGKKIKEKFNFFEKPFKSSHINVYATALNYTTEKSETLLQCIKCKLLSLIYHDRKIFIPILSTLK